MWAELGVSHFSKLCNSGVGAKNDFQKKAIW